jgi:hypothetical protein
VRAPGAAGRDEGKAREDERRWPRWGAISLDYLVGEREQGRRQGKAERLGGRKIDDEIELSRLLDRMSAGFVPRRIVSTKLAARLRAGR